MRQWKDLVSQLRQMCKELKFKVGDPLPASRPGLEIRQLPLNQQAAHSLCCAWDADGIHKSMLAGLLSMMGMQVVREPKASDFAGLTGSARARAMKRAQKQSKNDYQGARGTRFALFPASAVAKKTPSWVMSNRTGGNLSPVGPLFGGHRPRVGRTVGRPIDPHHVCGAALVGFAWLGCGHRARAAVWSADRTGPCRAVGTHQST